MRNILLKICAFSVFLLISSCHIIKDKNHLKDNYQLEDFFQDPRDYDYLKNSGLNTTCNLIKDEKFSEKLLFPRQYETCKYITEGKTKAQFDYSILKTDKNWELGTNEFQLSFFETKDPGFP